MMPSDLKPNSLTKTTLEFSNRVIQAEDIPAIFSLLNQHKTVTCLKLTGNQMGDTEAKTLASLLENDTQLTTLDLSDNKIRTPGFYALARALEKNKTLITLDLTDNLKCFSFDLAKKIDEQSIFLTIRQFSKALKPNQTILHINLVKAMDLPLELKIPINDETDPHVFKNIYGDMSGIFLYHTEIVPQLQRNKALADPLKIKNEIQSFLPSDLAHIVSQYTGSLPKELDPAYPDLSKFSYLSKRMDDLSKKTDEILNKSKPKSKMVKPEPTSLEKTWKKLCNLVQNILAFFRSKLGKTTSTNQNNIHSSTQNNTPAHNTINPPPTPTASPPATQDNSGTIKPALQASLITDDPEKMSFNQKSKI